MPLRYVVTRTMFCCVLMLLFIAVPGRMAAQNNTWIPQTSGTTVWLHGVDFTTAATGWVVGDEGKILKSTDTGTSWSMQTSGTALTLTGVKFIDASNGLACGGKGFQGVILKTSNGGANWNIVDTSTSLTSLAYINASLAWAVGPGGILKSTNGGSNWARQPLPDSFTVYTAITFFDADTGWMTGLSGYGGVVYKTTNKGSSWTQQTGGLHDYDYIDGITFFDAQHGWMSGYTVPDTIGYGMIKKTTDGGANWTDEPLATDQELYSIGFASLTEGWACGTSGILLHTTDGGQNWYDEGGYPYSLDKIMVRPGEGAWIVGLNGTILRNNFGGLSQQFTASVNAGWNMVCLPLAVADARKSVLYPTAASNAFRYAPSQGYVNADTLYGGTGYWIKFNGAQDIVFNGAQTQSITLNLVAGWNLVGGISADVPVRNIVQNPPNSIVNIYGFTPTGYQSDTVMQQGLAYWIKVVQDASLTLQQIPPPNVPSSALTDIAKFRYDELPPPPPGGAVAEDARALQLPTEYGLQQNYPNPFNPTTLIRYSLPEPSEVRVEIYDALGQLVATPVNRRQEAGNWNVEWNMESRAGTALSTGLYFYRLDARSVVTGKEYSQVKKMMIVK